MAKNTTFFDILKYFLMFRIFHVRMYDGNKAYHPSDSRVVEINREVRFKYELTSFDLRALILIKPRDVLLMAYPTFPPIIAPHSNRF